MSFCVTVNKSILQIVPSRGRVWRTTAMLFCGGVATIGGGVCLDVWFRHEPLAWWRGMQFFTFAGFLTALLLWGCAIWAWRTRHCRLSVDLFTREIAFGNRRLCGPGTVRSVELRSNSDPEVIERYSIHFRLIDGTGVSVPSPLFGGISNFEEANSLAELLAAKLNVHVCGDLQEC